MENKSKISEAEWEVMKVLWEKSPVTANDVVESLVTKTPWKPKTIKTLINRLVGKKMVSFSKEGREYHYSPQITEADAKKSEFRNMLKRAFDGALTPMMQFLLEHEDLSKEELEKLRELTEKAKVKG